MTAKYRQNVAVPLAGFLAVIGASALALQRWWLLPVLALPLAAMWWGLRSGVDVDGRALRVRGPLRSRVVPWSQVAGFRVDRRRVYLTLATGGELALPAVPPDALPGVIAAGGGSIQRGAEREPGADAPEAGDGR